MDLSRKTESRLSCIDALRGAVMIVMALDHVRDFFHIGAMSFSPTDLSRTTAILFFTRWVTHFCLPVFMFTAGMGIFLLGQRIPTQGQLSRFLWTRGLWFIVLELTVMQLAYNFSFSPSLMIFLLILWIFGLCTIAMAVLIYLPFRWLAAFSLAIIAFHNCLDGIKASQFGAAAPFWNLVHQPGMITVSGKQILVPYTFLPWIAVMAAGFCVGRVFLLEPAARQQILLRIGLILTIGFVAMRAINIYGDPVPWARQQSALFTFLSFLNCTKTPASLEYLLMTLGPSLLLLAYFDRRTFTVANPLIVFGRTPLFYFVLHFYLIHALAVAGAGLRYGAASTKFIFSPLPSMAGQLFPAGFGYRLWVVYAVWMLTVVLLYPLCRWFAGVKAARRHWWLSYL